MTSKDVAEFEAWWEAKCRAEFVAAYGPNENFRPNWGGGFEKEARAAWMAARSSVETRASHQTPNQDAKDTIETMRSMLNRGEPLYCNEIRLPAEQAKNLLDEFEQALRERDYYIAAHGRACQEASEALAREVAAARSAPETAAKRGYVGEAPLSYVVLDEIRERVKEHDEAVAFGSTIDNQYTLDRAYLLGLIPPEWTDRRAVKSTTEPDHG